MEDCKEKLHLVHQRLSDAEIKVNWEKCKFFVNSLPTIQKAKEQRNVTELKSYLGFLNYYNRFISNLSSKPYYLYALLRNNVKFIWDDKCRKAFEESKRSILTTNFLEFYDPMKPIVVV